MRKENWEEIAKRGEGIQSKLDEMVSSDEESAEKQLDKIKKLANKEGITLGEFGVEVLKIIDYRESLPRKRRK